VIAQEMDVKSTSHCHGVWLRKHKQHCHVHGRSQVLFEGLTPRRKSHIRFRLLGKKESDHLVISVKTESKSIGVLLEYIGPPGDTRPKTYL